MKLYFKFIKNQILITVLASVLYALVLLSLIFIINSNSYIYYKISPYIYASEIIDFFFALIVTIPFSYYTHFMIKDRFLDYVSVRISKNKYLNIYFLAILTLCFLMVFFVNISGIFFSNNIATIHFLESKHTLENYILGTMQMKNPIMFGFIWSFYKASIGVLICLFAQIVALYIKNLFLTLFIPFVYVVLENFLTSILGISRYSITTAFVLNRLTHTSMSIYNIVLAIIIFSLMMFIFWVGLRNYYDKQG